MPSLTIRNLEPGTKDELRRRANAHGRSMQDEARQILSVALDRPNPATLGVVAVEMPPRSGADLYTYIRSIVEPIGGIELELPPRDFAREPPSFD